VTLWKLKEVNRHFFINKRESMAEKEPQMQATWVNRPEPEADGIIARAVSLADLRDQATPRDRVGDVAGIYWRCFCVWQRRCAMRRW